MKVAKFSYCAATGWSSIDDETLESAKALDSENTLVVIFCAPMFLSHPDVVKKLRSHFPKSIFTGCSTSGEIYGEQINDLSISVGVLKFENSTIRKSMKKLDDPAKSLQVGRALAQDLMSDDLTGVLLLSEGLMANGSAIIEGMHEIIKDKSITIAGGLAGDGNEFQRTWLVNDEDMGPGMVCAVGFYGENIHMFSSSRGGWDIFGPERLITKSKGNVLYEIDGRPALDLYREYLGDKAKELPASGLLFPLQIRKNKQDPEKLVRTLLAIDEKEKSITFAGDVREGYQAQLMRANFERIIDAAGDAAEFVHDHFNSESGDKFTIAISCVGRRLVLGERAEEELESLAESLESDNVIGFYSYGELGAYANDRPCDLHNQSMTILGFSESLKKAG